MLKCHFSKIIVDLEDSETPGGGNDPESTRKQIAKSQYSAFLNVSAMTPHSAFLNVSAMIQTPHSAFLNVSAMTPPGWRTLGPNFDFEPFDFVYFSILGAWRHEYGRSNLE